MRAFLKKPKNLILWHMNSKLLLQLSALFILTSAIGLLVASTFIREKITVTIINEDKESVENTVGLFAYILVATGILLVLIRLFAGKTFLMFKLFEGFALFYMVQLVAYTLLALFFQPAEFELIPIHLALLLVILRNAMPDHVALRNAATIILAGGIGAVLGTGIGIFPIALFLLIMAVYDYIAVFKTKHMVVLAKAVTQKNLSFTLALPTAEHQFELGTGDLVMPLAFAVSILHAYADKLIYPYYFVPSILILAAALLGLAFTVNHSSKNIGKPLPALPLQTACMILVFLALQLAIPATGGMP